MKAKRYCVLLLTLCWVDIVTSRRHYKEGDVRLIGGTRRYMGTVVILHDGKWGSICDDHWGMNDAAVVCRQLGYTFAVRATTRSEFGQGRRRMWMSQVRCRGTEEKLADCVFQGYDRFIRYRCPGGYRSAGVICSAALPSAMRSRAMLNRRLIGRRRWRNMLPQTSAPAATETTSTTTTTTMPTTTTTTEATTTTPTTTTTTPTTTTTTPTTTTTTPTTTTTTTTTTEATTTTTMTTTTTTPTTSTVKTSASTTPTTDASIGNITKMTITNNDLTLIKLADKTMAGPVRLSEKENENFSNNVDETLDVDDDDDENSPETDHENEFENGDEDNNDHLTNEDHERDDEITENGDESLTEEDDENLSDKDHENLTQNDNEKLNEKDDENLPTIQQNSEEFVIAYKEDTEPFDESKTPQNNSYADDFMKNDSPQPVDETLQSPPETITVLEKNTKSADKYLADAPPVLENVEVKLEGGRYKWEGHLQVRVNGGSWGTICSDHWTLREVMVACNQLQGLGKAKQALLTNYFGGSDVPKLFHRIECVGRETSLSECKLTKIDEEHACSKKTAVAGIVCSEHLPDLIPNLRAVEDSVRLQDQPLYYLRCSMEENCLSSSAYVIKNTSLTWRNNMRRLLRFSTVVHNRGTADFRPYLPRGQWQWHACHMHYHSMEVFAHYDILDSNGTRLAEGSKASFCLEDTTCDNGVHPKYNCRGFADQGLSVNCSDNYMYDIDCQWIDISDIKPGDYTFLMEVNPTMLVAESDFDNNVVSCHLYYNGYFASLKRCHFESLLDHRLPMKIPA